MNRVSVLVPGRSRWTMAVAFSEVKNVGIHDVSPTRGWLSNDDCQSVNLAGLGLLASTNGYPNTQTYP